MIDSSLLSDVSGSIDRLSRRRPARRCLRAGFAMRLRVLTETRPCPRNVGALLVALTGSNCSQFEASLAIVPSLEFTVVLSLPNSGAAVYARPGLCSFGSLLPACEVGSKVRGFARAQVVGLRISSQLHRNKRGKSLVYTPDHLDDIWLLVHSLRRGTITATLAPEGTRK